MTERTVRLEIERLIGELEEFMEADGIYGPDTWAITRAREALADDPDVVKICRELLAEAETERRERRHNCMIIMATLEKAALRLQETFHFRLTDEPPGWEWTNE